MKKKFMKKTIRGMVILLAIFVTFLGAVILRLAICVPDLLNNILRTIGG